eukprot:CAMPEP_0194364742 /NCGR_PEP_ID=MMETSP0174-20130528/12643_1 /TAXON_ID=216777 /ORGANISM="Proboscia alata, Strain PI-D3" /LENGTH=697 /DNA_ID=CAMNT_0039138929 /DNA_START=24 /DNA_END=2117 /DNA_ORIENTATION=-
MTEYAPPPPLPPLPPSPSPLETLVQYYRHQKLSLISISEDGSTLTFPGDASVGVGLPHLVYSHANSVSFTIGETAGVASCEYTLSSVYLLLSFPDTLPHRRQCAKYNVPTVKILDKTKLLSYFGASTSTSAAADDVHGVPVSKDDEEGLYADEDESRPNRPTDIEISNKEPSSSKGKEKRDKEKRDKHKRDKHKREKEKRHGSKREKEKEREKRKDREKRKEKHRLSSSSNIQDKAASQQPHADNHSTTHSTHAPIKKEKVLTNEQLMQNLTVLTGKRNEHGEKIKGFAKNDRVGGDEIIQMERTAIKAAEEKTIAAAAAAVAEAAAEKDREDEEAAGIEEQGQSRGNNGERDEMDMRADIPRKKDEEGPNEESHPLTPAALSATPEAVDTPPSNDNDTNDAALISPEKSDYDEILQALSAEGYSIDERSETFHVYNNPENRANTVKIMEREIPVGNSWSILRNEGKDLTRVLDLYNEARKLEEKNKHANPHKRSHSSSRDKHHGKHGHSSSKKHKRPLGNPIIIVPNAPTCPITMMNSLQFFHQSEYIPREIMMQRAATSSTPPKRKPKQTFSHKFSTKVQGQTVEFEVLDDPKKLHPKDWDRIVAVIAQGASWQFKGWHWDSPVDIFSKSFGYYFTTEADVNNLPPDLKFWNVRIGKLARDKRNLDSVVAARFWNALEEWMTVHKPEYLASQGDS